MQRNSAASGMYISPNYYLHIALNVMSQQMNHLSTCSMRVLPTETALTRPWSPYLVDIKGYRTELTVGLTENRKQAKQNVCKAQMKQKKYYTHHSKESWRKSYGIHATRSSREES